jgi:hypothetical protein
MLPWNRRVEPFGEPVVDRREKITGFGVLALIGPEAGEAGSCLTDLASCRPAVGNHFEYSGFGSMEERP